ncbi:7246_t:CDS:2 [Funneliformis caledonium]|uniref:7246_t:CDS:1 n=1 Tax=Funneliformis caledonium TaxID=1117310 RepID=A0A9N9H6H5_9GLOM|nr:7246_t:CDS:2 [Funneliformis caledonium]
MNNSRYSYYSSSSLPRKKYPRYSLLERKDSRCTHYLSSHSPRRGHSLSIQRNCSLSVRDSRGCSSSIRNPRGHSNDHLSTIIDSRRFGNSHSTSFQRSHSLSVRDLRGHSSSIKNLRGHDNNRSLTIMDLRRFGNSRSPRGYDNDMLFRSTQYNRKRISITSASEASYHHARNVLEDMNKEQYKSFHDEVLQILSDFDDVLQLDHTKRWTDITRHIAKHTMKEIDKVMKRRFQYKNTELNLNPEKVKSEKKRKGINFRKSDKKERHRKGLSHIFNIKNSSLIDLKPSSLSWDEFKNDCELLMNEGEFYSNEVSESDDELAQKKLI